MSIYNKLTESTYNKEYYQKNKERILSQHRQWFKNHPNYKQPKESSKRANKKHSQKLRFETLSHYSDGIIQCNCCHEKEIKFLCLDHINGLEGKKRMSGVNFYRWLRKTTIH